MKANINHSIIDTGLVEFELRFDRGTEKVYFNPNDVDFFIRLTDMINGISDIYEEMEGKFEQATENLEKLEIMRELNSRVKDAFDEGFGNKVSDVIFKYISPHGIIKSKKQYYAFYILDYLMPLITEETGTTSRETNEALAKALAKHGKEFTHKI